MTYGALGGPKSAKRKIQIRQYVTEQSKKMHSFSDPFMPEDEDAVSENLLNPPKGKFTFRTTYAPDSECDHMDDILSSKIDLDEADKFIASLKIPSKLQAPKAPTKKVIQPRVFTHVDVSAFRAESEKLERLRLADSQDTEDDDSDLS